MPAKTEMSAQEWFHHSLFAVVRVTMPRRRKDSPLSCVHLCVALSKRRDAMAFGGQSSARNPFLHACTYETGSLCTLCKFPWYRKHYRELSGQLDPLCRRFLKARAF